MQQARDEAFRNEPPGTAIRQSSVPKFLPAISMWKFAYGFLISDRFFFRMKPIMTYHDTISADIETGCHHCGLPVRHEGLTYDGKAFCCAGCKTVYDILNRNDLCAYYSLDASPGITAPHPPGNRYAYLDDPEVSARLKDFSDGTTSSVNLFIPTMHCSSCVWLLESLGKLDAGIVCSRVDFLKKRVKVRFEERQTSLRSVVELLASLGYEPRITLESVEERAGSTSDTTLYYKIGVAGFCFSNIMILAFPEYLSGGTVDPGVREVFAYLSLILALPVFFYSAAGYFRSAYHGLRRRIINIDVPISLGIAILFVRSVFDIYHQTGQGYLDSMAGLVLFLLAGKLFQNKTYDSLNFERTYKSYFPLAVLVRRPAGETTVPVSNLEIGDRILIRNGEIIPADAVLLRGDGTIDYSFVTGESRPVKKKTGDIVFAGGRQAGGLIELEVVKEVSQSYLTQLWNDSSFRRDNAAHLTTLSNTVAKYFTAGVLLLASGAALYWFPKSPARAWDAVTGVLIVACPCALALAIPFAFGTAQRICGRKNFYLKNAHVVEALARVTTVVFDKTGTLSHARAEETDFVGDTLLSDECALIASLARNSPHPLSRALLAYLGELPAYTVRAFAETPSAGIEGEVDRHIIKLGSPAFVGVAATAGEQARDDHAAKRTRVYVSVDGRVRGYFALKNSYRDGVGRLVSRLRKIYPIRLLSGDSERERPNLENLFSGEVEMHFHQTPADKMNFVSSLQIRNQSVLMVGDGLNDAGALQKADVGVALTDDVAAFAPACDALLDGAQLANLDAFLRFCKSTVRVVLLSFGFSFLYNLAALGIAFRGALSPIAAAILMPLSSITVVVLATASVHLIAQRRGLL